MFVWLAALVPLLIGIAAWAFLHGCVCLWV